MTHVSRVRSVQPWGPCTSPTASAHAGRRCSLLGWRKGVPGGGAFHRCEGRLRSGGPPPPTARPLGGPLGSATHVLWARVCGCGGPTLSPWPACPMGAACPGGGGGPSPGGVACHRCDGRLVSGTTRGLPFNACVNARACTNLRLPVSILRFPNNRSHNHELYQGVAPPGLTYLTHRWRAKQGKGKKRNTSGQDLYAYVRMSNHPELTSTHLQSSNLSLFHLLALLQGTFTEKRDEQCACCIRDEHTCGLYLIH